MIAAVWGGLHVRTGKLIRAAHLADVSKFKSMWVGESEKNLKRLFSDYKKKVQDSSVTPILLFNEADAIFGIRKSGAFLPSFTMR